MKDKKLHIKLALIVISLFYVLFPITLSKDSMELFNYVISPVMWLILAIAALFFIHKRPHKFNFDKYDIRNIVLIGSLYFVIIFFGSGIFLGFANSPYNRSINGIMTNIWIIILVPLLHELVRDAFLRTTTKNNKWFILIVITIFLTFADLRLLDFQNLFNSRNSIVDFILEDFSIALINSSLLTYLAYKDGFVSGLLYKIPISIAYILTPVFPNSASAVTTVIQLAIPLYIFLKIENLSDYRNVFEKQEKVGFMEHFGNAIYGIIMISLGAFLLGLLPHYPIVIVSNSMYPDIKRGDIVVGEKITLKDVSIDDIIVYDLDGISVVHRVIEIERRPTGTYLVTKGDNNRTNDPRLVTENQVRARVHTTIPKLGYPTLIVRELLFGEPDQPDIERGDQ